MKARVTVTLKAGVLDPQGKAIEGALASLGIEGVASVRQGKIFDVELADDVANPDAVLRNACERLLANTVIENFRVETGQAEARTAPRKKSGRAEKADPAEEFVPDEAVDVGQAAAADAEMPTEGHP